VANILTLDEAARAAAVEHNDEKLLDILPQVDAYVNGATGHDWAADNPIHPEAKAAARLYLVLFYDLMSMQPGQIAALNRALVSVLTRLEALAADLEDA
jgi:hypothetical protein